MNNALKAVIVAGFTAGCTPPDAIRQSVPCGFGLSAITGKIDPVSGGWTTAPTESNRLSEARAARQVKVSICLLYTSDAADE